jgi:protein-tyrosine phosphatase
VTDAGGRVLVVCTGNVCRSPFMQLLLQRELDASSRDGGPRTVVRSAGTGALAGRGMDARAAAQATAYGLDPSGFVARQLTAPMVAEADLVLTATRKHRGDVATLHPRALRYTFALRDFAALAAHLDGAAPGGAPPRSQAWLQDVVRSVAARRGLEPPLEPGRADVVDPYRREDELFVRMADQISGAVAAVAAALSG